MKTLFMTKGLPASGKSTWSKEQVALSNGKTKRICKDDLRAMIDSKWAPGKERAILAARNAVVSNFLDLGYNVIVDDTNFAPGHENVLRTIATKYNAEFKLIDFTNVSVEECLKRDAGRVGSVGSSVILDMYYTYLCAPLHVRRNPLLPNCIITDVDGTIAKSTGRGPFEEHRVGEDDVRKFIKTAVLGTLAEYKADLIVFSGRQDSCEAETKIWLAENGFAFNALHMRRHGDRRPDYIVKEELYRAHIEGKYNVMAIFDDRPQVLRMWERIGLGDRLFRCGETMREF